jgi:UDP-2,3-diacylglucosamine hydrolase
LFAVPGSRLLVVADAHVGAPPPESEAALLAFLDAAPNLGDALLIGGDLFEFWFAYRHVIPRRAFPVAATLARAARSMPVAMVGGNHDRWGEPFWIEEAGIQYARRELTLEVGGRKVLALHGDGLTERPGRAAWTHRIIGHPATSGAFRLLHPDLGLRLVERLGPVLSSEATKTDAQKRLYSERQRDWAERRLLAEPDLGAIVMGHTHVAAVSEPAPGRQYVNPGAWLDGGRYAALTRHGAELLRFSPATPPPRPTAAPR